MFVAGIAFLSFLVFAWYARAEMMLLFAAVLLGVVLRKLVMRFQQVTHLGNAVSFVAVPLLIVAAGVGVWFLLFPEVSQQMDTISEEFPKFWKNLQGQLQHMKWLSRIAEAATAPRNGATSAFTLAGGVVTGVVGVLGSLAFVVFCGFFLAVNPDIYLRNFIALFPRARRRRIRDALDETGDQVGAWILGQVLLMAVVGGLTTLGLGLIGLPMALTLGLFTAVLLFIPYAGAIISAIPAILIGLMQSSSLALYAALVFVGAHIVEAYVVGPLIQKSMLRLPPALILAAQLLMAVIAGIPGVALSTPLLACVVILVRRLHVEAATPHRRRHLTTVTSA
jgi:predicted PurR-regulated permease PerM